MNDNNIPITPSQPPSVFGASKVLHQRHPIRIVVISFSVLLLLTWGALGWFVISGRTASKLTINGDTTKAPMQLAFDDNTLFVDSKTHSLGVRTSSPNGLQVQADVSTTARGKANVRLGLDGGKSTIILEDSAAKQWSLDNTDGVLRMSQPGVGVQAQLSSSGLVLEHEINVKGNTTLGSSAASTTTVQGTNLAIPNGLNIGTNALFIGNNGQVGVGTNNPSGYKLFVAGNLKVASTAEAMSFISTTDSAKSPGFTWTGNTNTGMFHAGANAVGVSANGSEVLRVQPGLVASLNGANIEAEGYMRAGRDAANPAWRIQRYTGTLDGSGSMAFGHDVSNGQLRIISVMAFYKGNSGEARSLSIDAVDASTVQVSGGIPGRAWRAMVIYTSDAPTW